MSTNANSVAVSPSRTFASDDTVVVWSRGLRFGGWLVERSFARHYVTGALGLPADEGQAVNSDGRVWAWFRPGFDPNSYKLAKRRAGLVELNPVDSAKALVKVLRKAFPGVKFARRMSRGTGYGTLNLSWVDGPTASEVDEIAGAWQGKSFDGMTDSTNYHRREVTLADGTVAVSGIGYLFTRREVTDGERERVLEGLLEAGYREHRAGDLNEAVAQITRGAAVFSACAHCNLYRVEV